MTRPARPLIRPVRRYPWRIGLASVIGLLVATTAGGLVALTFNQHVSQLAEEAIGYDIELEDRADDLRVAVLDVRHYHRNLLFSGPTRHGEAEFLGAYTLLMQRIGALDRLGVRDPGAPQPEALRSIAREYYAGFWPAVQLYDTDREAFLRASDTGLVRLDRLSIAAQELDKLGEQLASQAFAQVERENRSAALTLTAVLAGIVLVGAALAYTTVRILRMLQDLYAAQQQVAHDLSRSLQEKADFIADVSHELRTPLTVLRGNAEHGLATYRQEPAADLFLDIVRESTRLSSLVDDLLILARSQADMLQLDLRTVATEPWLAELATRAEVLARQRGADFTASLEADCEIRIDRGRVEQAVLVLVDNATSYSPPGEVVHVSSYVRQGELVIEVRDRGPGIPAEEVPLIFERFHRAHGTADVRESPGAGLGLAIAHSIVSAHGGTIEVSSQMGVGTTMRIRLPAAENVENVAAQDASAP